MESTLGQGGRLFFAGRVRNNMALEQTTAHHKQTHGGLEHFAPQGPGGCTSYAGYSLGKGLEVAPADRDHS